MCQRWPLIAVAVAASVVGCAESPQPTAHQPAPATTPSHGHEHATATPALSAEDQVLADKQKNCPVGGEALGSMGTPVKMMVGDRAVFLCCEGCRGAVEKNPEKYLAILDAPADAGPETTTEAGTPTDPTSEPPAAEAPAATDGPAKPE